ncbi:MAG: 2-dehydro-3-deoxygalactonokinase [Pseudomonadota bacterium]
METSGTEWIAVDWGTTRLRCWLVGSAGEVLKSMSSEDGMGSLKPNEFEPALLKLLGDDLQADRQVSTIACGMVGARQGWTEAAYVAVPCYPPDCTNATFAPVADKRLRVIILPGLSQTEPADVMRGEETQIAGYLANYPNFRGTLCLPGTHTKWVKIDGGQIRSFTTFMTGDLFAAITRHTVLRHSIDFDWDDQAFDNAVDEALRAPDSVSALLFNLRAGDLLENRNTGFANARASGLLMGLELAGARTYWEAKDIALVGSEQLCTRYARALEIAGQKATLTDGDHMVLSGLKSAYASLAITDGS